MKQINLRNCWVFFTVTAALVLGTVGCTNGSSEEQTLTCNAPKANGEAYGITKSIYAAKNGSVAIDLASLDRGRENASNVKLLSLPCHGRLAGGVAGGARTAADLGTTYEPNTDYVGPDGFEYELTTSVGDIVRVRAFIDVKPCLRLPVARELAPNMHVVSARPLGWVENSPVGQLPSDEVLVDVSSDAGAATLYLVSDFIDTTKWRIRVADGASIEKIILVTPAGVSAQVLDQGNAVVQNAQVSSVVYSWDPSTASYGQMIEAIRAHAGKNEATFQGALQTNYVRIPPTPASVEVASPLQVSLYRYYDFVRQDCTNKCATKTLEGGATHWAGNFERVTDLPVSNLPEGYIVKASSDRLELDWFATAGVNATKGHACGKHYFEVQVSGRANGNGGYFQLGISNNVPFFNNMPFYSSATTIDAPSACTTPGSSCRIGIAMDLDAGVIYFSQNGTWLNGADPSAGTGGTSMGLYLYAPFFPAALSGGGINLQTNFGATQFQYPVPTGFEGW